MASLEVAGKKLSASSSSDDPFQKARHNVSELDDIQEQLIEDNEKLNIEVSRIKAALKRAEEKVAKNEQLNEYVETLKIEAAKRTKQIHDRQEKIKRLEGQLAEHEKEAEINRSTQLEKEQKINELLKEIDNLRDDNLEYQKGLKQKTEMITEMVTRIKDVEQSCIEQKAQNKTIMKYFSEVFEKMEAKNELLGERLKKSDKILEKLEAKNELLEERLEKSDKLIERLVKQQDTVEKQQAAVNGQLLSLDPFGRGAQPPKANPGLATHLNKKLNIRPRKGKP